MSVIEAASVGVKTMADGTLRLTVDIEPRNAQAAFALFGAPGTPMALAALKTQAEAKEEKPKGGLLSQWAAMRCAEPEFQRWLKDTHTHAWESAPGATPAEKAAGAVRGLCSIDSRAELDSNEQAAQTFHRIVRGPWQKHYQATHA